MPEPARTLAERTKDTLRRLEDDVDCWVSTAGPTGGEPWLIPLSYLWDGESVMLATPAQSATGRNLLASGTVRLGIGPTRDVILIEGEAEVIAANDVTLELGDAFAKKTGFDPRELTTPYLSFRIRPRRIQAWREANELEGRDLMRDGTWLTDSPALTRS